MNRFFDVETTKVLRPKSQTCKSKRDVVLDGVNRM